VSSRAKILIKSMLDINVKTRLSTMQAIQSNWVKMLTKIDGSFRIDTYQIGKMLTLLQQFNRGSRFRLIVLHFTMSYFNFEQ
jgi:hypothetical protein